MTLFILQIVAEQVTNPYHGDTESSLGYYFYDGIENVTQINKLSLANYQNLDEWWYIGNDLTFDYDYYYLNNNEKVSVKQYIDIVQTSNSGDTGKFYIPRIDRQQLDNLPNETGFYLDLTVNSGDIVLANQFYSFVTYSSVVDSGATGTITNTSGDVTGNIDLTGIQSALTNEANFENVNISSGDISSSLGFNFETDPYANFWLTFTQGLNTALNTSVRTIQIPFRDKTYTINLDNYTTQEPSALKVFFATISSTFVCLGLLKWIKKTIDEITSGDVDNLLKNNQEERNYKFILGGVYMIEALFSSLMGFFFWLIGLIGSIVIYPIQLILVSVFPALGDYISGILTFLNNQFFPYLSFAKELLLDLTCLPRPLFSILVTFIIARWTIAPAIRSIKLILNIWKIKGGGNAS